MRACWYGKLAKAKNGHFVFFAQLNEHDQAWRILFFLPGHCEAKRAAAIALVGTWKFKLESFKTRKLEHFKTRKLKRVRKENGSHSIQRFRLFHNKKQTHGRNHQHTQIRKKTNKSKCPCLLFFLRYKNHRKTSNMHQGFGNQWKHVDTGNCPRPKMDILFSSKLNEHDQAWRILFVPSRALWSKTGSSSGGSKWAA